MHSKPTTTTTTTQFPLYNRFIHSTTVTYLPTYLPLYNSYSSQYKIRPGPDPKRPPEETEWLTNPVLQKHVLEPSHEWVDMGEGELGKVYVEILGCDGLPNMDSGGFYGNKTDTFVACVYEDVYGRTDVIDDCLSPRWLPWSNRAFIFSMGHPSSLLNIG